jgi:hypothetical protein
MRLGKVRAATRVAVVDSDTLGLRGGQMAYHPDEIRLQAFDMWLKGQLSLVDQNHWWDKYVTLAWKHGATHAYLDAGATVPPTLPLVDQTLLRRVEPDVSAITAVILQQSSRVAERGVLQGERPTLLWRQLAEVFEKVGAERLRLMADHYTVAAHNRARLEVYRQAGQTKVGVVPEQRRRRVRDSRMVCDETLVGVLTAGDIDVCDECEDFADGMPYDIDEVNATLPLHPRCRCKWYPWFDMRFAHDHDRS